MTIQAVRQTKKTKTFLRNSFRLTIKLILLSLIINCLLIFGIYTKLINNEPPDYYATNGITPPTSLTPLLKPNETETPLLGPEPVLDGKDTMVNYKNG